ncbi:MAG: dihydropteroate synthase [Phycisphaeraceae bacterium]|nr:dihydropteroate synthase [Phycisphaeraceae bacterium]
MAIDGLTIIGESINDSVPSTKKLFDAGDLQGLKDLAKSQDEGGATYIDVNVGPRSGEFLAEMVKHVQSVTAKPVSVDTPDPAMAELGLKAVDVKRCGGKAPLVNSISPLRLEMFGLVRVQPFRPILLASERNEGGKAMPNHTAEEVYETAKLLVHEARKHGIANNDCVIDPAIAPIGSDSEGHLRRVVDACRLIHGDPDLKGVHMSVGLSNFTVMLPMKRPDGSPVKGPLESAFLTITMPLGMDHVIGSVKRKYELLDDSHPAMQCVRECLTLDGFDVIMRVQEYYNS